MSLMALAWCSAWTMIPAPEMLTCIPVVFYLGFRKREKQVSRALKVDRNWNNVLSYMILKIIFKIKFLFITFRQPNVSP